MERSSAASRLLRGAVAQLQDGSQDTDPYDVLSPRQKKLLGAATSAHGSETRQNLHKIGSGFGPSPAGAASVAGVGSRLKLALSNEGVLRVARLPDARCSQEAPLLTPRLVSVRSDDGIDYSRVADRQRPLTPNPPPSTARVTADLRSASLPATRKQKVRTLSGQPRLRPSGGSLDDKLKECKSSLASFSITHARRAVFLPHAVVVPLLLSLSVSLSLSLSLSVAGAGLD